MSKSSRRAEAARSNVAPAAEDLIQSAADRVGPLAQQAADRVAPLAGAAAEAIGAAAQRVSPLAHSAAERLAPYASQAAERVSPYAHQAADFVSPYAHQASEFVSPYAHQAAERLSPLADTAKQRGTRAAQEAKGRVSDSVLPRISEALSAAAASPAATEVVKRREAALAALRGELELPVTTEKKKKGSWLRRLAIFAALGGIAVVVARKFLGGSDADWQAARPTTPYSPPSARTDSTPSDSTSTTPVETQDPESDAEDDPQAGFSAHEGSDEANGAPVPEQPAEGGDALEDEDATIPVSVASGTDSLAAGWVSEPDPDLSATPSNAGKGQSAGAFDAVAGEPMVDEVDAGNDAAAGDPILGDAAGASGDDHGDPQLAKWSGEGVYVGEDPPEGFIIKGNERSMKYHLPESSGYGRTIAEVWFNSEQAAQGAGFIRAQR